MAVGRELFASSNKDSEHREEKLDQTLGDYGPDEENVRSSQGNEARRPSLVNMSQLESGLSVGKQMEMEADNAIKYRTCSWQKVHPSKASQELDKPTLFRERRSTNSSIVLTVARLPRYSFRSIFA